MERGECQYPGCGTWRRRRRRQRPVRGWLTGPIKACPELEDIMTDIGILGSGRVAKTLATKLAAAGHAVTIGTRDPDKASAAWTGQAVTFADHRQTARQVSIVINATPGDTSLERLSALRDVLDGKILIDVSNATERSTDGMPGGLSYPNSSLAEHLQ